MVIYIGRNKTKCLIDKEDFKKLNKKGNYFCNTEHGYIVIKNYLGFKDGKAKYKEVYLHRMIMSPPSKMQVDHINGNKLDNRRKNLRLCTAGDNSRNKAQFKGKYKGVYLNKKSNKWVAQITFNYKVMNLGTYKKIEDAALAYNKKAKELHGNFAFINKIKQ